MLFNSFDSGHVRTGFDAFQLVALVLQPQTRAGFEPTIRVQTVQESVFLNLIKAIVSFKLRAINDCDVTKIII